MAWKTEVVPVLRVLVDDLGTTQSFTDLILVKKLVAAAMKLIVVADWTVAYATVADDGDGTNWDITPDPTTSVGGADDKDFVGLLLLRAQCDHIKQKYISSATNAIRVRDGSTAVDTSVGGGSFKGLLERGSPCEDYETALRDYQAGNGGAYRVLGNFGTDQIYRPGKYGVNGKIDRTNIS